MRLQFALPPMNLPPNIIPDLQRAHSRRWFMKDCGLSLGAIALASLEARANSENLNPMAPKNPNFGGKAKNVIYLFMGGAPSHLDLFDNKPELARLDGTKPPAELLKGYQSAFINPENNLLGPKFKFKKYGKAGTEMADILPHIGSHADDIAVIRSMHTEAFNHAPAQILLSTGSQQFGRPSIGSWVTYGLGCDTDNLPAFVVISSGSKSPSGGAGNFNSGFLPSIYDGVQFRSVGDPVLFLSNP